MPRKLTHMARAEKWYAQQVKNGRLRASDYSMLSRKMALCYEPATMMSQRNEVTKHDILSDAKTLKAITEFKL